MAKQTALYLTKAIKNGVTTIVPADTTGWKSVYTAGGDDAVVKGLLVTSDDTAAVNLRVGIEVSSVVYQIGCIAIAAGSGTSGSANAVDAFNALAIPGLPLDRDWKRILPLAAGAILKVAAKATVGTGKTVTVVAIAEEY